MSAPSSSIYGYATRSIPILCVTGFITVLVGHFTHRQWVMTLGTCVFLSGFAVWGLVNGGAFLWGFLHTLLEHHSLRLWLSAVCGLWLTGESLSSFDRMMKSKIISIAAGVLFLISQILLFLGLDSEERPTTIPLCTAAMIFLSASILVGFFALIYRVRARGNGHV